MHLAWGLFLVQQIKSAFADCLIASLKRVYAGQMPSISVIARDFAFRGPHLPHVSGETVRKWLRGESLPHVSRMQVLIEWLGPEIALPFEHHPRTAHQPPVSPGRSDSAPTENIRELVSIASHLTEKEYQSVLNIARLLVEKHPIGYQPVSTLSYRAGNGHDAPEKPN